MREKPRDENRLRHIIKAIENIEKFLHQYNSNEFAEDSALYFAIVKNLEIIGEAAYMLTHEFREAHPHTPWKQIIGMRHCLVHGYYQISLEETWNTANEDIPILKKQIIKYLEEI